MVWRRRVGRLRKHVLACERDVARIQAEHERKKRLQTKYLMRLQRREISSVGEWFGRWKVASDAIAAAEAAAAAAAKAKAEAEAELQRRVVRGAKIAYRVTSRRQAMGGLKSWRRFVVAEERRRGAANIAVRKLLVRRERSRCSMWLERWLGAAKNVAEAAAAARRRALKLFDEWAISGGRAQQRGVRLRFRVWATAFWMEVVRRVLQGELTERASQFN